ncbi:tetratricopeptide repeat protein [Candidatus Cloacimonadota bacterium]
MKNTILILIIFLSLISLLHSAELENIFQKAVTAFENKDFETSLELFLSLENEGISNPDLYYNIGNCHFRTGSFGRSILYYKRALKIDQDHKPSQRNLDYVLTFTQDKQLVDEQDLISSIWNKLLNSLSLNTLAIIVISVFCLTILLLILITTVFRHRDKTSLIFSFSLALIVLFILSIMSFVKYDARSSDNEAVLISTSTIGYSGPGIEFTRVFTIHEGMIFEIEKTESDWSLIKLPNGLGGWIKVSNFIKI